MDPETGEMLFFGYSPSLLSSSTTSRRDGRLVRTEPIDVACPR
jgi:carotenoid cleavage dioxygenase-like enzyme